MKLAKQAGLPATDVVKSEQTYVLATSRSWNEGMSTRLSDYIGRPFNLINRKNKLSAEYLDEIRPRYLFFPHWSHIIPESIFSRYECVIFHMTDLPFGRGGSPLQNLISRGVSQTMITALRCVKDLDAGPVYLKRPLSLQGSAEEIYLRASEEIEIMIKEIVQTEPDPRPQAGQPVVFKRRRPEESEILGQKSLNRLYDHVRMLDAEGYPPAFLEQGVFRFEFSRASLKHGKLVADVTITEKLDE